MTPLPPSPTGVADYSELLLTGLARATDWKIEAVSPTVRRDFAFAVTAPESFPTPDERDVVLYHVGNSRHHDFVYPFLLHHRGVVVLHDLAVHHARLMSYLESPEVRAYRDDLADLEKRKRAFAKLGEYRKVSAEAYADNGETIAEIALRAGGGRLLYDYPLFEDLVRQSRRTIVHSESARQEVLARCPEADVRRVRMGVPLPLLVSSSEARRRVGLSQSAVLLASFGLVTPEKRITAAIRALARLRAAGVDAHYLLVGDGVPHYDPLEEARALGVAEHVRSVGRVSDDEFTLYAFASDLCLNLRYPSAGETSATLLRLLGCGRPVVVTNQVHVGDLPESVVSRSELEGEEDGLYCDLMDLIRSMRRRRELGENARRFAEREASVDVMVADYVEALEL
ncbi:MAG TPA: glycosyltransferase family 4 protein [Vicinamibacteria bacterium]|nr:glycosyltransferase family 4 protein [Vicinamibacteria bacterium]